MTIVAVWFLVFVHFFDWMIYGQSKFTLVKAADKIKGKSRLFPVNEATLCGAQDINTKVKIKFDDSYFVVDTIRASYGSQNTLCLPMCLETNSVVNDITSSKKLTRSLQLGYSYVLLEQPHKQAYNISDSRLVVKLYSHNHLSLFQLNHSLLEP